MGSTCDDSFLGFTKQTAIILEGLGVGHLIPQFKKRNISTSTLSELSKEDFVTLGVDEILAESIISQLITRKVPTNSGVIELPNKSTQLIEIVKNSKQRLALIQHFITYTRLKLGQQSMDYIIDVNSTMKASQGLSTAAYCALEELNDLNEQIHELLEKISVTDTMTKSSNARLFAFIGSIGLSACLLYTSRYLFYMLKKT